MLLPLLQNNLLESFGPAVAPTITTTSLPSGAALAAYSQQLEADGTEPITWELDSGTLPAGLELSVDGLLSGIAGQVGTFSFVVSATNGVGSDMQSLSLTLARHRDPPRHRQFVIHRRRSYQ